MNISSTPTTSISSYATVSNSFEDVAHYEKQKNNLESE
jgi:hypothetical protein